MSSEKREQRYCLCGWYVYGTDLERRNAFAAHWASEEHKNRLRKRGLPIGAESTPSVP